MLTTTLATPVCDDAGLLSEQDLKLTAALWADQGADDHLRRSGRLPDAIGDDSWWAVPQIIATRGTDLALTPDEQLVYDAFCREGRVPNSAVRLMVN